MYIPPKLTLQLAWAANRVIFSFRFIFLNTAFRWEIRARFFPINAGGEEDWVDPATDIEAAEDVDAAVRPVTDNVEVVEVRGSLCRVPVPVVSLIAGDTGDMSTWLLIIKSGQFA